MIKAVHSNNNNENSNNKNNDYYNINHNDICSNDIGLLWKWIIFCRKWYTTMRRLTRYLLNIASVSPLCMLLCMDNHFEPSSVPVKPWEPPRPVPSPVVSFSFVTPISHYESPHGVCLDVWEWITASRGSASHRSCYLWRIWRRSEETVSRTTKHYEALTGHQSPCGVDEGFLITTLVRFLTWIYFLVLITVTYC